jgi:hypothetical protein
MRECDRTERLSTEDKVRMDYLIGELKQFGDGVQQRGDDRKSQYI